MPHPAQPDLRARVKPMHRTAPGPGILESSVALESPAQSLRRSAAQADPSCGRLRRERDVERTFNDNRTGGWGRTAGPASAGRARHLAPRWLGGGHRWPFCVRVPRNRRAAARVARRVRRDREVPRKRGRALGIDQLGDTPVELGRFGLTTSRCEPREQILRVTHRADEPFDQLGWIQARFEIGVVGDADRLE